MSLVHGVDSNSDGHPLLVDTSGRPIISNYQDIADLLAELLKIADISLQGDNFIQITGAAETVTGTDTTIATYIVPAGKVCYVTGYNCGPSVNNIVFAGYLRIAGTTVNRAASAGGYISESGGCLGKATAGQAVTVVVRQDTGTNQWMAGGLRGYLQNA